ncbi:ABC transporter permease [Bacteroides sp. 51]|nr:ABC transporter permease [Bacteroides sp. 51]
MIKVYFKQAWQMLKQNKLYSSVYIVGTGLAIAMTMVIAIVYYIKIAPIYPENNRNRTLIANSLRVNYPKTDGMSSSLFSYEFVKEHLYTMQSPELVSAVMEVWDDHPFVELDNERGMLPVKVRYTDHNFWNVFSFDFIHGTSYTDTDFQSAIKTAVISASLAKTLFGTTEAEGKRMMLDGNDYRISGAVRDVSLATPLTYAQIWVPFTIRAENLVPSKWGEGMLGALKVIFLAKTASDAPSVKAEADEILRKINNSQDKYVLTMSGQPDVYWKSVFRQYNNMEINWVEVIKTFGTILLALLIIPAVNLGGMVSSRMEKRLAEVGLRKAFGASYRKLMHQILTENFLLTFLGGAVGLIISYILIYTSKNWVLTLFDRWPGTLPEGTDMTITIGMLFNPAVFFTALAVCFILNLLSAIIPVHYGLKKGIVYSLSNNK